MLTNEILNPPKFDGTGLGQVVLVLQGGGALGAYQLGVYQRPCGKLAPSLLAQAPWTRQFDPLEGFILHEAQACRMMFDG